MIIEIPEWVLWAVGGTVLFCAVAFIFTLAYLGWIFLKAMGGPWR